MSGGRDSVILLWGDESDEPKATIPTYEPLEGALIRNDHIYTIGTRGTKSYLTGRRRDPITWILASDG